MDSLILGWTGLTLIEQLRVLYTLAAGMWLLVTVVFGRKWIIAWRRDGFDIILSAASVVCLWSLLATSFYCTVVWTDNPAPTIREATILALPVRDIGAATAFAIVTYVAGRGRSENIDRKGES